MLAVFVLCPVCTRLCSVLLKDRPYLLQQRLQKGFLPALLEEVKHSAEEMLWAYPDKYCSNSKNAKLKRRPEITLHTTELLSTSTASASRPDPSCSGLLC